ncbi:MAG: sporulation protein YunB [Clostridia bacterium]
MQDKRKKIRTIIAIILIVTIAIMLYTSFFIIPLLSTLASEEVKSEAVDIINLANDNMMKMSLYYDDYFEIFFDNNNEITGIQANTGLINQINSIVKIQVQDKLDLLRTKQVNLPLGAFTGSSIIAQFGGLVPVNIKTICNCSTKITSYFDTAGFNQVCHRLVITVSVDIKILLPVRTDSKIVKNEIVLAETIISGEVPDTLLMGNEVADYLDLNP